MSFLPELGHQTHWTHLDLFCPLCMVLAAAKSKRMSDSSTSAVGGKTWRRCKEYSMGLRIGYPPIHGLKVVVPIKMAITCHKPPFSDKPTSLLPFFCWFHQFSGVYLHPKQRPWLEPGLGHHDTKRVASQPLRRPKWGWGHQPTNGKFTSHKESNQQNWQVKLLRECHKIMNVNPTLINPGYINWEDTTMIAIYLINQGLLIPELAHWSGPEATSRFLC